MLRTLILLAAVVCLAYAAPGYLAPWAYPYAATPYVLPAPYAYHSGYSVLHSVEPVEQHGYEIAF